MQKGAAKSCSFLRIGEGRIMEDLNFYTLNNRYVDYLKQAEFEKRGFSRVPNMSYGKNRKQKFLCGVVLNIHNILYFAPITSYKKQQADNFLIYADNGFVTSSLRFNYMFPVPPELLRVRTIKNEPDRAYRALLSQELKYCIKNQNQIRFMAHRTYKRVMLGKKPGLMFNSCDFALLEQKCIEYCRINNLAVPISLPQEEENQQERTPFNDLLIQATKHRKDMDKSKEQGIER